MLIKIGILLLAIAAHPTLAQFPPGSLIIITGINDGIIQGTNYLTPNNKTYYGFRGIPYATPPVGDLRFEAPQPPQPWDDVRDAFNDSKSCITINHSSNADNESEDCLYINVYTPILQSDVTIPVLFWIHGGAFTSGDSGKSFYGPDYLMEEDVVVVTFNYRVGPAGFLSTADSVISGNAGLKDQNLALKWTYDNIETFGGDPEKIIVFGQSAGAYSVGYHLISEKSAGLFRGAIVESGSAVVARAIHMDPRSYAFLLADAIPGGDYGNDTQLLKEFLLNKTAEELITAANSLPSDQYVLPVIEVEGEDAFLTESPYELLESGRFNQVPIVIGICAEESLMFLRDVTTATEMAHSYDTEPSTIIPKNLRQNSSDEEAVIEKIKDIYLNGSRLFADDFIGLAEYYSDNRYTRGVIKHAELSSNFVPVFLYQFAYYGRPMSSPFIDGAEKAGHAAELPFIFYINGLDDTSDANLLTQNRMIKLWTNFAKYLNPTPEISDLFNNITWPTISPTNQTFLNINGTLELRSNLRPKTYPKWNEIFETYGRKPFISF